MNNGTPQEDGGKSQHDAAGVGPRLRELRLARRLTLADVAERANVSESFVSQLERGKSNASIASLKRIAGAIGYSISGLFEDGRGTSKVLRAADRPALQVGTLGTKYLLSPSYAMNIEVVVAELPVGATSGEEEYTHGDSEELVLVLHGYVVARVAGTDHPLLPGDSIYFRSSEPHKLSNMGAEPAEVIWIISPPSY